VPQSGLKPPPPSPQDFVDLSSGFNRGGRLPHSTSTLLFKHICFTKLLINDRQAAALNNIDKDQRRDLF
jgi:hypothetical protein